MIRVRRENLLQDRGDARLGLAPCQPLAVALVALSEPDEAARHGAEQRQCIEAGDLRIGWIAGVHLSHSGRIALMARCRIAVTEKDSNSFEEPLFFRRA